METTRLEIQPGSLEKVETGGKDGNIAAPATRLNWNHEPEKGSMTNYADFLDLVLESLPYPFYVIDAFDYTVQVANSAAQFGRLSEESTCYALTHKIDRPCCSAENPCPCPVEEVRKTKRALTVEHVHYDGEGNPRNVEIHAFPVLDNEGNVSQIIEYVLDTTARKQAEEALKWELAVNSALARLYEPLISPETSMAMIGRIVLDQAKALTNSAHGYVSEIDPTTGDNISHTLTDMLKGQCEVSDENRRMAFPRGKDGLYPALWGHSLNTGQGFYTNSPAEHQASTGIPEGHVPINRFLSVPVMLAEQFVGQIALANKDGDFTERDFKAICRLSELYALAIQRKRAEDALKKAHDELDSRVKERTAELEKSYEERAFIRETFGTYLSHEVATEVLESPNGIKLGGEVRDMTILVSDLRGFTTSTEAMEAPQIVQIINRYLEQMIPIIMRHEGTVDEFTGDGILAFFGAPRHLSDHPIRAVACALEMQASMQELNKENLGLGLPELEMGIGISCGDLVVGNIGSQERKKYGAVGKPINVAFRLEEKARPGEIVVTQAVKDRFGDKLLTGWHWKENLKGMGNTTIYRVAGIQ